MKTRPEIRPVSASAGSGKTHRLTGILEELLGQGKVRPEALVATTFTNKAAAELQERVRERLLKAGRRDEALRLGAARIGTVNAVCSRLVSDFALDLGLSPDLRVLDEAAAGRELKKALSQVLDDDGRQGAELKERLVGFDLGGAVQQVVNLARSNDLSARDLQDCARRSWETLRPVLVEVAHASGPLKEALAAALREFCRRVDLQADGTQATADACRRARAALHRLDQGRSLPWSEWSWLSQPRTGSKSRALWTPVTLAAAAHESHPLLHQDLESSINLVFDLAARALEAYAQAKRAAGVVDFTDQEVLTLGLLQTASAQEILRANLDLLLVDEFQDTSPLQLAIFLELASLARESWWVGDQKQAIFGFRGTDPALMDAALQSLSGGPAETLPKSWRSRPPLVQLTSQVFAQAFAGLIPAERVTLEAAREDREEAGPCVEFWSLTKKGRSGASVHASLATTLRAFLADPAVRVEDRLTHELRRPTPADVAVLCFSNKTCRTVAAELELRGVPAVLPRQGLLGTPEGLLVHAGLRLWADPWDTLARAELARLTDYADQPEKWLARQLEGKRQAFDTLPAVSRLLECRQQRLHAAPLAVTEAVLEAVGAREMGLAWGQSERRLANLEALRGLACAYVEECRAEGRGSTVAGLVAWLDEVKALEADDQAPSTREDAVTVSTWHRAKGLEWPVTVLYDLDQLDKASPLGVKALSGQEPFSVEAPLAGRWIRYWPYPYQPNTKTRFKERLQDHPAWQEASEVERRERLRLLYVGWTRARDILVLAGLPGIFEKYPLTLLKAPQGQPLLTEPTGPTATWAGYSFAVKTRREETVGPDRRPRTPGEAPVPAGPRPYPPASELPSQAKAGEGEAGADRVLEVATLGPRLPLAGAPDMQLLGQAVHTYLAADRPDRPPQLRLHMAQDILDRWQVSPSLRPQALVSASQALHAWVETRWPEATWHRELAVHHRLPTGTLVQGQADLVLSTPDGLVVIDHKTFPGHLEDAQTRALGHAGQLAAYARACTQATGQPVLERWIHLPVLGQAVRV